MTNEQKIAMVQTLVGDPNATSEVINVYLSLSAEIILNKAFPFHEDKELPSKYDMKQCEIACYLYNKRGAEGEIAHQENGINRSYESASVPSSMLKGITPYCEVL